MRIFAISAGILCSAIIVCAGGQSAHAQTDDQNKQAKIVKIKDTLEKIAKENDTTYPRLFDANLAIKDPNIIFVGDKIRIPDPKEDLTSRTVTQAPDQTAGYKKASSNYVKNVSAVVNGGVWDRLAACESGGNWSINTGNGYYGGLQFTQATWNAVGGSGSPSQATKSEQIKRGKILQARSGWGQWPACSAKLGLR
jgi:LysM repeat protein